MPYAIPWELDRRDTAWFLAPCWYPQPRVYEFVSSSR
jgi:hypothetical protein